MASRKAQSRRAHPEPLRSSCMIMMEVLPAIAVIRRTFANIEYGDLRRKTMSSYRKHGGAEKNSECDGRECDKNPQTSSEESSASAKQGGRDIFLTGRLRNWLGKIVDITEAPEDEI